MTFTKTMTTADRFWNKVDRRGPNDCWNWASTRDRGGYGAFSSGARPAHQLRAHRVAYELSIGPIPDGLELDHLCRNPACVNPAHLEPVTHAENLKRSERANRTHCPQGHPYDEENTYTNRGGRFCRACNRAAVRRYKAKRKGTL